MKSNLIWLVIILNAVRLAVGEWLAELEPRDGRH